jgi:hypothetical protein
MIMIGHWAYSNRKPITIMENSGGGETAAGQAQPGIGYSLSSSRTLP